jgi:hypothetical protein
VMRYAAALGEVRFSDPDVEPLIEVARIGVDDFSIEFLGQSNAERRLADCGRTGNHDDARARFLPLRCRLTGGRLVVARCHGIYYDDIESMVNRLAGRCTVRIVGAQ